MGHVMRPLVSAHVILWMKSTQRLRDKCGQATIAHRKHAPEAVPNMASAVMMALVLASKDGLVKIAQSQLAHLVATFMESVKRARMENLPSVSVMAGGEGKIVENPSAPMIVVAMGIV